MELLVSLYCYKILITLKLVLNDFLNTIIRQLAFMPELFVLDILISLYITDKGQHS